MQHTQQAGFVDQRQMELLQVDTQPLPLLERLAQLALTATEPDDYSRI